MNLHGRADLDPPGGGSSSSVPQKTSAELFSYVDQQTSIDATSLTQQADRTTLSAQSSQSIQLEAGLLLDCLEKDSWAQASGAWKSASACHCSLIAI